MRYVLSRLLHAALLLCGVSLLSFALFEIAPGDYLDEMRANPQIPAATVERYRQEYGLDRPAHIRYSRWGLAALRGDLGVSFLYNVPTVTLLWPRVCNTLQLAGAALLLTWIVALLLGVRAAAKPSAGIPTEALAATLVTLPDLLIALLCLTVAVRTGWFTVSGSFPLAVLCSSLIAFPAVFRHTRRAVADLLRMPFVEHLRACGVPESRVLFAHALPAAAPSLITLFGLSVAALLSSGLIVEVVLGWPGLGPLLLEAILARDFPVVIATVMMSSLLLVTANLASDLALYASDPRVRRSQP